MRWYRHKRHSSFLYVILFPQMTVGTKQQVLQTIADSPTIRQSSYLYAELCLGIITACPDKS